MMKHLVLAALLALGACGNNSSGVMREIERAEKEEAAQVEDPYTLASGVEMQFQRRGTDQTLARPSAEAVVLVHYEGSLVSNGEVFDSSFQRGQPVDFPLPAVVRGFSEAIQQMRPGDEVVATFPGELGYGERGSPPVIPPNAALRFRIQLIAFQEADGTIVGVPQ
ncbi:MAG: FKBP-type peptidyl-prolyl cis-trans isomerase [Hyphomonadaceae bacterium]